MLFRLCLFLQVIFLGITANAADVRIAVSDLIAVDVLKTIKSLAVADSLEISVASIGSLPAMDALRMDEISLAVIAMPDDTEVLDDTLKSFPFAYVASVVAVNRSNPINEISFYDLRGIFGLDLSSNIENWRALGAQETADRLIKPVVVRDRTSISTELFQHIVLNGEALKHTVNEVRKPEVEAMLVNNPALIAIVPYLPSNESVKALMISPDADSPAFGPANDNIYYGDYPIRLPFQVVYRKSREQELAGIIKLLLSDEVAKALRFNHLSVPPDTIRASIIESLNLIER